MNKCTIGLDFGTNSVRSLIVDTLSGKELATYVWNYQQGESGVIINPKEPYLARQHPEDYIKGTETSVRGAIKEAKRKYKFQPDNIIGIGVDTTGSTPIPVDKKGTPLALHKNFYNEPDAMAWLWKDHSSFSEAGEITNLAKNIRPGYLEKCGGIYSSEWFWSKILHCARTNPKVFDAAYSWVELADWVPAFLTGTENPKLIKRGICAAGHKAMFHTEWKGYPDNAFLKQLDKRLIKVRSTLPDKAYTIAEPAGYLTKQWAEKLGLTLGIPVAVGAFDAHLGGVGSGIQPGVLVKIIGTSTCDMMVAPLNKSLPDIPGLCGIVPESILPGYYGLEAGQSGVGDIFNWFVNVIRPVKGSHETLTLEAKKLKPGKSGLLGLDWHNGNRTVLVDQRVTGSIVGMTLHTTSAEIYRTLVESTAFGAKVIMERFEEYGIKVNRIINCGGISVKNPFIMQIYADIMNRPLEISQSPQTCAFGAAMAGAVVAGKKAGGYDNYGDAIQEMTGVLSKKFKPIQRNVKIYNQLYVLYKRLHDIYGIKNKQDNLYDLMKELQNIRDSVKR